MGAAYGLNVLASIAKFKVAAILLGPAGVGLIGLFQNLVQTGGTLSAFGIANAGTRQVAAANASDNLADLAASRQVLFIASIALGLIGGLVFWLLSEWLALTFLNDPSQATNVAWLSIAVVLTVFAGAQSAWLAGLRRIGDVALVHVITGIGGALLGIGAIFLFGSSGVVATVILPVILSVLVGYLYTRRTWSSDYAMPVQREAILRESRVMFSLGLAFMLSGLVGTMGNLVVRGAVQNDLGLDAVGQFQAAWSISMTYLALVLRAMTTDYYPRLSAAISKRETAIRMVNEQTEVTLFLAGPVLLTMIALAPWVIRLLYSEEFAPAATVLRWQVLGDTLKIISWPLGFILLASGAGKRYLAVEFISVTVFVVAVWLGLPTFGINAAGMGFVAMYVVYLPMVWLFARSMIGFRWKTQVWVHALMLLITSVILALLSIYSEALVRTIGIIVVIVYSIGGFIYLSRVSGAGELVPMLPNLISIMQKLMNPKR